MTGCNFQRARRPEQVQARRDAILEAAVDMLRERPVADISLRELSERVGLAKSNVLRYFDSREAIFLEILDVEWTAWLDEVAAELAAVSTSDGSSYTTETAVATVIASSLLRRRSLCELLSAMAAVLERNISVDFARTFKRGASAHTDRLAALVADKLPKLSLGAAVHFAGAAFVMVGGLWPYANPTDAVATVMAEMGSPTGPELFAGGLTEGLVTQLIGLAARSES